MKRKLQLARGFSLPVEIVTDSLALLGKRGAGKTYAASAIIEEMLAAKLSVVVLDPMGVWWGLRSDASGDGEGFPIPIIGGDHADVPLEPTGGQLCADLIVDEDLSAVLDLSLFSKNERRQFVADFLERLYRRNRDPRHVVLEEADLFAPEGKLKRAGDERMLGAVYDLVRRGRSKGLGITLICQRSASLSKEVLTQTEILVALRTTGPHDRKAIEEWIHYHGTKDERDVVLSELATLPTGEAYVWWPMEGILKRIRIREKRTFDSSATPKPGEAARDPKSYADVDMDLLGKRMAETVERAKANDPKELRRRLANMEEELRRKPLVQLPEKPQVERIEVPVFGDGELDRLEKTIRDAEELLATTASGAAERIREAASDVALAANKAIAVAKVSESKSSTIKSIAIYGEALGPEQTQTRSEQKGRAIADRNGSLSAPQQRILDGLAWLESTLGRPSATRVQAAFMASYKPNTGNFQNILGELRRGELIDYPAAGMVALTELGRDEANFPSAPGSQAELHRRVLEKLPGPHQRVLSVVLAGYPDRITRDQLAESSGYQPNTGNFQNILGRLRKLGLIDYPAKGEVVATDDLFPLT